VSQAIGKPPRITDPVRRIKQPRTIGAQRPMHPGASMLAAPGALVVVSMLIIRIPDAV
jgi:hypothetical protein